MANSNGNAYPYLVINNWFQVLGVNSKGDNFSLSNENFALDIGISEDGTIWAISVTPDPDGGGGRIYWSTGNGTWNEISTSDPGGVKICGGTGSSCFYITSDGVVRTLDTDGTSSVFDGTYNYLEFNYGGGYVWAVFSLKDGDVPQLYYSDGSVLSWNAFAGNPLPSSISSDYAGTCFAVDENNNPVYYSTDGTSTGTAGSGIDGMAMQISSKNWTYVVTFDAASSSGENPIYKWVDESGGKFEKTNMTGMKVLSTYHTGS